MSHLPALTTITSEANANAFDITTGNLARFWPNNRPYQGFLCATNAELVTAWNTHGNGGAELVSQTGTDETQVIDGTLPGGFAQRWRYVRFTSAGSKSTALLFEDIHGAPGQPIRLVVKIANAAWQDGWSPAVWIKNCTNIIVSGTVDVCGGPALYIEQSENIVVRRFNVTEACRWVRNDMGAIYFRGAFRRCRGHQVLGCSISGYQNGIYMDDGSSNVYIDRNVVDVESVGILVGGGSNIEVTERNNVSGDDWDLFIDSRGRTWDETRWKQWDGEETDTPPFSDTIVENDNESPQPTYPYNVRLNCPFTTARVQDDLKPLAFGLANGGTITEDT